MQGWSNKQNWFCYHHIKEQDQSLTYAFFVFVGLIVILNLRPLLSRLRCQLGVEFHHYYYLTYQEISSVKCFPSLLLSLCTNTTPLPSDGVTYASVLWSELLFELQEKKFSEHAKALPDRELKDWAFSEHVKGSQIQLLYQPMSSWQLGIQINEWKPDEIGQAWKTPIALREEPAAVPEHPHLALQIMRCTKDGSIQL